MEPTRYCWSSWNWSLVESCMQPLVRRFWDEVFDDDEVITCYFLCFVFFPHLWRDSSVKSSFVHEIFIYNNNNTKRECECDCWRWLVKMLDSYWFGPKSSPKEPSPHDWAQPTCPLASGREHMWPWLGPCERGRWRANSALGSTKSGPSRFG